MFELFKKDEKDSSLAQFMLDSEKFRATGEEETRVFREYIVKESIQQYRDYYETDAEEQGFFEYLGNLPNRDKIRFMECFEDFTEDKTDNKDYVMIQKREYNPELSVFSNLILDLQDFKDRVRPLARDIALMDVSRPYQKHNVNELEREAEEYRDILRETRDELKEEEGYSSKELEDK